MSELNELTPSQLADMKAAFDLMDENGDGEISARELESVMRSFGMKPSEEDIKQMIHKIDLDNNGAVNFEEFVLMMKSRLSENIPEPDIHECFQKFDRNGDGYLSAEELQYAFKQLGENLTNLEIQELMKEADGDNDGRLSYEEFRWMMLTDPSQIPLEVNQTTIIPDAVGAMMKGKM